MVWSFYRGKRLRRFFRGDAAFALPSIYELLEAAGFSYAICLPANTVLQGNIIHLLKRPVGRPAKEVHRYYANSATGPPVSARPAGLSPRWNGIRWTRLSCRKFAHNAVRLQLHVLAYNLTSYVPWRYPTARGIGR
jgi:hypothetical protein